MGEKENLIRGLKKFLESLSLDFKVKKILLFGSRATKNFREDSDVDLIIISDNFENMNFFERGSKMYDYWELDLPVDFICYTSKEFEKLKKGITIAREAVKEGIEI